MCLPRKEPAAYMDERYVVTAEHFQRLCQEASDEDLQTLLAVARELLQCAYNRGLECLALLEEEMSRRNLPVAPREEHLHIRHPF
jgi:hypothetical protein